MQSRVSATRDRESEKQFDVVREQHFDQKIQAGHTVFAEHFVCGQLIVGGLQVREGGLPLFAHVQARQ